MPIRIGADLPRRLDCRTSSAGHVSTRVICETLSIPRKAATSEAGARAGRGPRGCETLSIPRKPVAALSSPLRIAAVVAVAAAALLAVPLASAFAQTDRFDDVADGAYYTEAVADLDRQGVFVGTECEEGFCPGTPIDRKTMAVWVVRTLEGQDPPTGSRKPRFDDIDADSFYAPFIERMAEVGITLGCGDGTRFCPDQHVTRAQMAVFLVRAYGLAAGPGPVFADVAPDAWYGHDVARLAASGITLGCGDGTRFCPDQDVARAEMATFLWRAEDPGDFLGYPLRGFPRALRHVPIDGSWSVPVFFCGPDGKYTADDVSDLTSDLNISLKGFFERASSQRMSLVFEEGSVVTADIDWEDTDNILEIQSLCRLNMLAESSTPQVLIVIDTEYLWGYGGRIRARGYGRLGGVAAVIDPNRVGSFSVFSFVVRHELAHSILQLDHLQYKIQGFIGIVETIDDLILACYQYDQLGWPVPEYAQPCRRLTAPETEALELRYTARNEARLTWHPPRFSDDAPITGYTVSISRRVEGASPELPDASPELVRTYELGPEARSQFFARPEVVGTYILSVRANTQYGPGDSQSVPAQLVSAPPPPADFRVVDRRTTSTSVSLSWDQSNTQPYVNVRFEVEYSGGGSTLNAVAAWNGQRLTGLEPGTEYSIRVRSCSDPPAGWTICGAWGIALTAETEHELPPPDPISVAAGRDWYLLTWEPVPGAVTYQIELPDGVWTSTHAPNFEQTHNVEPGTVYPLKVRSCSRQLFCEWGDWQAVTVSTTHDQVIPPPYQISLQEVGDSWADLRWKSVSYGQAYRVEYEYTDGDSSSGLLQHGSPPLRLTVDSNKTYSLKLRNCPIGAQNAPCSSWTSFVFTTEPLPSPVDPPMIEPGDIGDIWFDLYWDPIPEALSYDWRYKREGENDWQRHGNVTRPNLRANHSLNPSTAYVVEIRSCGEATRPCSDWASTTVSTVRSFPSAPPSFSVSVERVTENEIFLTWNPPTPQHWLYDVRYYPTADKGSTSVRRIHSRDDAVLSRLDADTAYTLQISTCRVDTDSGGLVCDGRVTIEASTRKRN